MASILVVEDDALMQRVLAETLRRAGHVVTVVGNGGEAQAQLGCDDVDGADPYPDQQIFGNFRTRHANPHLAPRAGEVKGPGSVNFQL